MFGKDSNDKKKGAMIARNPFIIVIGDGTGMCHCF
jgi:hypothetical protein